MQIYDVTLDIVGVFYVTGIQAESEEDAIGIATEEAWDSLRSLPALQFSIGAGTVEEGQDTNDDAQPVLVAGSQEVDYLALCLDYFGGDDGA